MPQLLTNVRTVFSTCALCKETNVLWPAICKGVTTTMGEATHSAQVQKCSGGRNGNSWILLLPAREVMLLNLYLYTDPSKANYQKNLGLIYAQCCMKTPELCSLASSSSSDCVCEWPAGFLRAGSSLEPCHKWTQKTGVPKLCSENAGVCHPAMDIWAAQAVSEDNKYKAVKCSPELTLAQHKQPCSCTDIMLLSSYLL